MRIHGEIWGPLQNIFASRGGSSNIQTSDSDKTWLLRAFQNRRSTRHRAAAYNQIGFASRNLEFALALSDQLTWGGPRECRVFPTGSRNYRATHWRDQSFLVAGAPIGRAYRYLLVLLRPKLALPLEYGNHPPGQRSHGAAGPIHSSY